MFEGKEKVEIGRFVDGKIVPTRPAKHKKSASKLIDKKGTDDVDFEIRFVDKDVKPKKNHK